MRKQMPTKEQFKAFCKAHDVEFYSLGCPENWNDSSVFRVATIEFPQRGITVPISKIQEWLRPAKPIAVPKPILVPEWGGTDPTFDVLG
jgi:hypothetical protein